MKLTSCALFMVGVTNKFNKPKERDEK